MPRLFIVSKTKKHAFEVVSFNPPDAAVLRGRSGNFHFDPFFHLPVLKRFYNLSTEEPAWWQEPEVNDGSE